MFMFYWTWSIIGILIIILIITLLILALIASKNFIKLAGLIYKEQQDLITKIKEVVDEADDQVNQDAEIDEVDLQNEVDEESHAELAE
jgi:predicted Holliday junction resolvase-like endonuclease